jgi:hypothetical protein
MMVGMSTAIAEKTIVPMSEVRAWALRRGMDVKVAGNVPTAIVEAYNRAHRNKQFERRPAHHGGLETR